MHSRQAALRPSHPFYPDALNIIRSVFYTICYPKRSEGTGAGASAEAPRTERSDVPT